MRSLSLLFGCALGLIIFEVGECIQNAGLNPFEAGAIAPDGAPALSQQAVEPASGLAPTGFDHTIAGEN